MHWESPSIYHSVVHHRQEGSYGLCPEASQKHLVINRLGTVDYGAAYRLQKEIHQQRVQGRVSDTLLLLEHPPTLTVGKAGNLDNILVSPQVLEGEGIALYFTDRGGDVTYHGPGQLVGYTIMNLNERDGDLKRYVHELEETVIRTLGDFSIHAGRDFHHVGVWVGQRKIAAIGLSIRQGVTMHGFALNVNPCLEHFSYIHPCGLKDRKSTSLLEILGFSPPVEKVVERLVVHFSEIFDPEHGGISTESYGQ